MISREDFSDLFKLLLAYHGKKYNAEMASAWHYRLRFRSVVDVKRAFEEGKAAHRSMPTLNEVCTYLPRYESDVPADEKPIVLTADEEAFNAELWPHFNQFARDVVAPRRQDRLAAYDLWHMTFKGVCIKRKMLHLYDEETWIRNRQIHERKNRDAVPPPLADAGRSGGQPTQPPQ